MPKLNRTRTQHRIAELFDGDTARLAVETDIPWGSLRNAVAGRDPLKLNRVYRIGRALARDGEDLQNVVADILAKNDDGIPDGPPDQPDKGPKHPPPRKNGAGKGPRKADAEVAA